MLTHTISIGSTLPVARLDFLLVHYTSEIKTVEHDTVTIEHDGANTQDT